MEDSHYLRSCISLLGWEEENGKAGKEEK